MNTLYTIGHSTHTIEQFIKLLGMHAITAVCDVRSSPYSSYNPQFNRESLMKDLKQKHIAYVYLGEELGPRSDDPNCYRENKVQYNLLAETKGFKQGLERIRAGMQRYRIALMCAEKDPIMCHRTILVCRHIRSEGIEIRHILEDGSLETNENSEKRLMRLLKVPEATLFESTQELTEKAYDIQSQKIAHSLDRNMEEGPRE